MAKLAKHRILRCFSSVAVSVAGTRLAHHPGIIEQKDQYFARFVNGPSESCFIRPID
jgi:hypothetical protein